MVHGYYIIQLNCFFWHLFEIFDARAKIFALTNLAMVKNLLARCQKSFSNSLTNYYLGDVKNLEKMSKKTIDLNYVLSSLVNKRPAVARRRRNFWFLASATIEHRGDGQNWIKFIPFVCPSHFYAATIEQPWRRTDELDKIYSIRPSVASPCRNHRATVVTDIRLSVAVLCRNHRATMVTDRRIG